MVREGKILGHIVSKNGISTDEDKILVILNCLDPPIQSKCKGSWVIVSTLEGLSFDLPTLLNLWLLFLNGKRSVRSLWKEWGWRNYTQANTTLERRKAVLLLHCLKTKSTKWLSAKLKVAHYVHAATKCELAEDILGWHYRCSPAVESLTKISRVGP